MSDPKTATRGQNRDRFPEIARFVDELRETFGDVSVTSLEPEKDKEKAWRS